MRVAALAFGVMTGLSCAIMGGCGASSGSAKKTLLPIKSALLPMPPCADPDETGLQQRSPGELVKALEITPTGDATFPASARAWRVLYVSTGADNTERTLVCGVVVAPDAAAKIKAKDVGGIQTGEMVAWTHGTIGLVARCQPSFDPSLLIWGPTPFGINTISWKSSSGEHVGRPEDGILAGMINDGYVVAATDYYTDPSGGPILQADSPYKGPI